jgi:hypothetical protein
MTDEHGSSPKRRRKWPWIVGVLLAALLMWSMS